MQGETVFLLLFIVATAVAIAARRLQVPYTVALVLAGLALGPVHAFEPPHLTKELLFSVFLPGLLFEAAFHLEFAASSGATQARSSRCGARRRRRDRAHRAVLVDADDRRAPPGRRLRLASTALVFGALIAATDPIAVVALFKSLGAPQAGWPSLVEGESLLNDGTAIVFFTLDPVGHPRRAACSVRRSAVDFVRGVGAGARRRGARVRRAVAA